MTTTHIKTSDPQRIADGETFAALNAGGLSYTKIAAQYGVTKGIVGSCIALWRREAAKDSDKFGVVKLGTPLNIHCDNAVIVGDVHVPCTDYEFSRLVLYVARKQGVKTLIVAGDTFNMDSWSKYQAVVPAPKWQEERDAARVLFSEWVEWFDDIYVLMGNHDRRLQKWSGGQLGEADIFGMVDSSSKVHTSNFGWMMVETAAGEWRVTHSSQYSINQLTVAEQLALKHQCNVITHHEHHAAIGWDRYGRYVIVNNGALVDPAKLAYVVLDDSKNAVTQNAFTVLRNGVPRLYGKSPMTDWGEV